jgi:hypothetical protein
MTSQNLASNGSSHDNLKIRVRCDSMSLVDQTRCTVALDTPTCLVIEWVLHRCTSPGGLTAPVAHSRMRRARKTIRFSLVPALAIASNSWRCVSVSSDSPSVDLPTFDHTPDRVLLKTLKRHYTSTEKLTVLVHSRDRASTFEQLVNPMNRLRRNKIPIWENKR